MAKIAFIMLCHKNPEAVVQQARQLIAVDDYVAIHFDGRSSDADFELLQRELGSEPNVTFAPRRVKCGWGEWSLVEATLVTVRRALEAFPKSTHLYMVSGDCMAIKSAAYARDLLDRDEADFIESFDFFESDWIKTGIKEERLIYRHWFNERSNKRWYYLSLGLQRKLGLKRAIPADLQIQIGSQWWCLRRQTVERVIDFVDARKDVVDFFRRTWIPDETFFQTLVRHLVPGREIRSRSLTFLMFTDYGYPVTFYNDHYDLLLGQGALFARKVSPEAKELRKRLGRLWASDRNNFAISDEGRSLFGFLTSKGRVGHRFAPRFWESETTLGRDRELLIVACKKWHVAKRLLGVLKHFEDVPAIDYLFNEEDTALPDLGGIQATLAKRTRHRRALIRMLFDYYDTGRLVICLDTASIDLMSDFFADRSRTKLLEVECDMSDDYLIGHAQRVGLAGANTSPEAAARLLPTLRRDIGLESERIGDAGFANVYRLREHDSIRAKADVLRDFFSISDEVATKVAGTDYLFVD